MRRADEDPQDDWQADWESHRRWQLTAALAATPAQRLAWLEAAIEFAARYAGTSGPSRKND